MTPIVPLTPEPNGGFAAVAPGLCADALSALFSPARQAAPAGLWADPCQDPCADPCQDPSPARENAAIPHPGAVCADHVLPTYPRHPEVGA